jgi:hypothetical protein
VPHTLLVVSLVLFALWLIGLAGAWAAHTAWTLFVIACLLFTAWLLVGALGRSSRRRPV